MQFVFKYAIIPIKLGTFSHFDTLYYYIIYSYNCQYQYCRHASTFYCAKRPLWIIYKQQQAKKLAVLFLIVCNILFSLNCRGQVFKIQNIWYTDNNCFLLAPPYVSTKIKIQWNKRYSSFVFYSEYCHNYMNYTKFSRFEIAATVSNAICCPNNGISGSITLQRKERWLCQKLLNYV